MLTAWRFYLAAIFVFGFNSFGQAGVGFDYGPGTDAAQEPFNFAVATAPGNTLGMVTAEAAANASVAGPLMNSRSRRSLDILSLFQRFDLSNFSQPSGGATSTGNRVRMPLPQLGLGTQSLAAGGVGLASQMVDATCGYVPVSAVYCFCICQNDPNPPSGGNGGGGDPGDGGTGGSGGPGGGDGGPGDGGPGGGDPGNGDPGGGGNPNPSVVPEPGSGTLWTLAGALLVWVTRRPRAASWPAPT